VPSLGKYRMSATEPEFLIDTVAINRKYAARKDDPRRTWTGAYRAPKGCSPDQFERISQEACHRFVEAMRKKGWDIYGKPQVHGPRKARDLDGLVLLDMDEYLICIVFKLASTPKPIHDEVPTGLIKRDPEHTITLAEAVASRS
jgi:hypothetical protein